MKTVLRKLTAEEARNYHGPVFAPVDDDCDGIPYGEIMADLKKNRNPGNHRRYMAFIKQTFDMQDDLDNIMTWRKYMQMKAGHYEAVVAPNGHTMYWPRTINWDEMEEIEFKHLFNDIINAFIKYYGGGLNDIQLNSILEY